jgi:NADH dehydrogenase
VLTRNPDRARQRLGEAAEIVLGDVCSQNSLPAAMSGVDSVVSAVTGFGPGAAGPRAVDYEGNVNLIRAAEAAVVRRFVLFSMRGARPDHPMQLLREKHRAEQVLRASRLSWTIVRPTVFMELWIGFIGDPILKSGACTVFGPGTNPINFVSVRDLARVVVLLFRQPFGVDQVIEVGGPDNLSFNQLVQRLEAAFAHRVRVRHVPVVAMRLGRTLMRPLRPDLAGLIEAGIATATTDMTFDPADLRARFPGLELTPIGDAINQQVLGTTFSAGSSSTGGV